MLLLNIDSKENKPIFEDLFSHLEEQSGLNLMFVYGYGSSVSPSYINESITGLRKSGAVDKGDKRPIFPIVIAGYNEGEPIQTRPTPSFSLSHKYINNFPREGIMYLGRLHIHKETKVDGVLPIMSPSGSLFGEVYIPKETNKLITPLAYIYYNFFEAEQDDLWRKAIQHTVATAISQVVEGFEVPEFVDESYTPNVTDKCIELGENLTRRTRENIVDVSKDIENTKSTLLKYIRKLQEEEAKLTSWVSADYIQNQLEIINKIPEVLWFDIKDNNILVMLDRIVIKKKIEGSLRKYDIGNIIMKIDIHTGNVYFDNVTQRVSGLGCNNASHPHDASRGDNKMCLGEISQFVPMMLAEMELASLVELLINYAKSVNLVDVAGKTIYKWRQIK